jgi:hypothetical protein
MRQRIRMEQSLETSSSSTRLRTKVQGIMLGLRQLFRLVDCTVPSVLLLIALVPREFPLQTHKCKDA